MALERKFRNLALVGFMGSGKSSVGRALACSLGFEFLDTDELIESRAGKPIGRIFAEDGEPAFRAMESGLLDELRDVEKKVISVGGGLVTQGDNMNRLKAIALVFCLWAGPDTIWRRVRNQRHRPLLDNANPRQTIRELLENREPYYRQSDILVNTDRRSVRQVAHQIIHQYRLDLGGAADELSLDFSRIH